MHKWWARRLGSVFRLLLLAATLPANKARLLSNGYFYKRHKLSRILVLDPFVGGGTSVVEAAKCGASVVGIDIDPVACFVTTKELQAFNENTLRRAFAEVEQAVKERLMAWYRTTLSDGREGTIMYAFWVDRIKCPGCRCVFDGHPHFQLRRFPKTKRQIVFCRNCGEIDNLSLTRKRFTCKSCYSETEILAGPVKLGFFNCPSCEKQTALRSLTSVRPFKQRLFALEVRPVETKERVFKRADNKDLAVYRRASDQWAKQTRNRFVPSDFVPVRHRNDTRPVSYGYRRYRDLFNPRQLLCLSALAEAITRVKNDNARELLALAFSDCLAANNMFCYYAFDYGKLTPLFGLHAYVKVSRPVENNVWGTDLGRGSFSKCFYKLLEGKRYAATPYEYVYDDKGQASRVLTGETISCHLYRRALPKSTLLSSKALILNRSSEDLRPIPANAIDLILSDPPYYDNLAYSELSDFFHVWLKLLKLKTYPGNEHKRTPLKEALFVASSADERHSEHVNFSQGLTSAFSECHRVLKKDGLLVFTFHHNNPRAWAALAEAVLNAGFRITNAFPVRSEGQSQFHSEDGNLKWDEVLVCRKDESKPDRQLLDDWTNLQELLEALANEQLRNWSALLKKNNFEFTAGDQRSLKSALILMHLSTMAQRPSDLRKFFASSYSNGRLKKKA